MKAYNAHDAKLLADLFLPEAQIVDEQDNTIQGQVDIEALFAGVFEEAPDSKIEVAVESIRFIGTALAIETGTTTTSASGTLPERSRYSVLHVQRDGKWLMGLVRDMPAIPTHREHLQALAWLVGDWIDESREGTVKTSCRWADKESFLLQEITVRQAGRDTMQITQRIGRDPLTKKFKDWRGNNREDWQNFADDHHSHYGDWYHDCWHGGAYAGARWDHMWNNYPVAAAFGVTAWGVNRIAYGFGYAGYSNPYPSGGGYDYSQPLVSYSDPAATAAPTDPAAPVDPAAPADPGAPAPEAVDPGMQAFNDARTAFQSRDVATALTLLDNGASGEGTMNGLFNEATYFNGVPESVQDALQHIDDLGGPNSYGHYAAGWAVAGDTPFAWTKQVAGSYGGTRNGLVIHWPQRIKAKGEIRSQWHHVIDIAPTILEAAGVPEPKSLTVFQGMTGMTENVFLNTKNQSHTITAEVQIPEGGANGVIIAQAGRFGGWSLYLKDGKPRYTYNYLGRQSFTVASDKALPAGKATIRYEFAYEGVVRARGARARFW